LKFHITVLLNQYPFISIVFTDELSRRLVKDTGITLCCSSETSYSNACVLMNCCIEFYTHQNKRFANNFGMGISRFHIAVHFSFT